MYEDNIRIERRNMILKSMKIRIVIVMMTLRVSRVITRDVKVCDIQTDNILLQIVQHKTVIL
jgi:hypothetical protein